MTKILIFSLLPSLAMLASGSLALWKQPGENLRGIILHFAAGAEKGVLLSVALAVEVIALALAMVTQCIKLGWTRKRSMLILASASLLFIVVAVLGATLLKNLSQEWLETLLSFGVAALLYLVTEELLVEAHEIKEKSYMTLSFFAGFLIFVMVGMYV